MNARPLGTIGIIVFFIMTAIPAVSAPQTVETKDGIRIIHNGKTGRWGTNPKAGLELIRIIGDIDTEDENLAFDTPGNLVEDRRENIYIADVGNVRIQKFDKNGKFLASLGRKGQGPGEFDSIDSLDIDAKGRLWVLDRNQRRLMILTPDGREDRAIRFLKRRLTSIRPMKDGSFLVSESYSTGPEPVSPTILLKRMNEEEEILGEFCLPVDFGEAVTNQSANGISTAIGGDGSPVISFYKQNRVEKYSTEGKILWRADRPLNFDTKVIEKGEYKKTADSASYKGPKMNLCSNGVAVDGAGRIWVVTCRRQIKPEEGIYISKSFGPTGLISKKVEGNTDLRTTDMFQLDIFDPQGVLLGTLPVSQFVDGIWIWGDRLYLLDRDHGAAYHQYRIVER
ncbi:MAG: 6-bladed beta-propeller [Acidobacteriota bacterium]|nr:6-bladed beta-propeller [Acidobacteriota bacterium]